MTYRGEEKKKKGEKAHTCNFKVAFNVGLLQLYSHVMTYNVRSSDLFKPTTLDSHL